jgi:hypothetical protein
MKQYTHGITQHTIRDKGVTHNTSSVQYYQSTMHRRYFKLRPIFGVSCKRRRRRCGGGGTTIYECGWALFGESGAKP